SEAVAQTLVDVVGEYDVQLVIMGEPARTSLLEPWRWGTISQRVIRDVDVPVLVYPVDPADPERMPSVYLRRGLEVQARGRAADDAAEDGAADQPNEETGSTRGFSP
ncbi:MAG TPA: universal stress protein, partial [Euzebya sp.]|nr:universal stress protein [Euzebya sp.]